MELCSQIHFEHEFYKQWANTLFAILYRTKYFLLSQLQCLWNNRLTHCCSVANRPPDCSFGPGSCHRRYYARSAWIKQFTDLSPDQQDVISDRARRPKLTITNICAHHVCTFLSMLRTQPRNCARIHLEPTDALVAEQRLLPTRWRKAWSPWT